MPLIVPAHAPPVNAWTQGTSRSARERHRASRGRLHPPYPSASAEPCLRRSPQSKPGEVL
jgi:hypothetical protein